MCTPQVIHKPTYLWLWICIDSLPLPENMTRMAARQRMLTVAVIGPTLGKRQRADIQFVGRRGQRRQQRRVQRSVKLGTLSAPMNGSFLATCRARIDPLRSFTCQVQRRKAARRCECCKAFGDGASRRPTHVGLPKRSHRGHHRASATPQSQSDQGGAAQGAEGIHDAKHGVAKHHAGVNRRR
jgi:hypothetical protein